jgi:hypothetical protein
MKKAVRQALFWAPRSLAIVFILFIGLFALEVFGQAQGFLALALSLLVHLLPSLALLACLLLAWRRDWLGAALFAAWGAWFLVEAGGTRAQYYDLVLPGVSFLIGVLFLLGWIFRRQFQDEQP